MKVLYIFTSALSQFRTGVAGRDYPDMGLYGLNHMAAEGITADYKESKELLSRPLARLLGFRLRQSLMFFATGGYDVVFGSPLLYMLIWKKIITTQRRFVIFNINLVRLLESSKRYAIKHTFLCWLLAQADGIVNLSRFQQEYLEREVPVLQNRMRVIPLGIDASFYHADQPRKNFLLAVGRDNGRDYATVLEVARRIPDRDFVIICSARNLVGVGEIPKNVTVYYDISPARYRQFLEEAFALLLIIRGDTDADGSDCSGQTVLLEAMASGCPIIATRKAYLEHGEYVTERKEALFVPVAGVQEICACLHTLDDASVRLALGRAARERAEKLSTVQMSKSLAHFFRYVYER